jgi:hypothetical protein
MIGRHINLTVFIYSVHRETGKDQGTKVPAQ